VREFPDQAKAIVAAGHLVGSHSDSHPHFCSLSNDQIAAELKAAEDAIVTAGGQKPVYFRAPFGEYDDRVVQKLRDSGYRYPVDHRHPGLERGPHRRPGAGGRIPQDRTRGHHLVPQQRQRITEYLPALIDDCFPKDIRSSPLTSLSIRVQYRQQRHPHPQS
jgi:peptidoglycan/xylan/chitin deacetylase (PgdA/CDA1 family)